MKKEITLVASRTIQYVFNGAAWILYGIFNLFDNKICNIMSIIFMLIAFITSLISIFGKREEEDEMGAEHLQASKARTLDINIIIILTVALVALFCKNFFVLDFVKVYPFIIGTMELFTGVLFVKYEKVGE